MSNVVVGALTLPGFNAAIGADIALSSLTVALGSDQVTGVFPSRIVGLGGFKITLPDGVYDVESVESVSALTLTTTYAGVGGTVSATLHKFAQLRIYALSTFTPSGSSEVVQIGAPHSSDWFRRYAASVINDGEQNVLYLPEIIIPATTDSSNANARYFVGIYGQGGQFIRQGPVSEFRLDTTTPTSWAMILDFNSPPNPGPNPPENFYTAQEIDARFPSGSANQLLYFENTGNVLALLTLSSDFSISSDILSITNALTRIQEEGANLPQRPTLNFVGSSFTAADDTTRTTVTADSDLNAIASNSTNGIYARTGSGTVSARTITGTADQVTATNGDGVAGNPTLSLPTTVKLGTPGGSPAAGALAGPDASGTNTAGAHLELSGGPGTGNAIPGQVVVRYPLITASGTSVQSFTTSRFPTSTSLYTNTAVGTAVANTVVETSIFTGATASSGSTLTVEGGSARAGTMFRLRMVGAFGTTGTPTFRVRVKLGGSTISDSTAVTSPNNANGIFLLDAYMFVNSVGATGQIRSEIEGRLTAAVSGAVTPVVFVGDVGPVTIDFTANQAFDVTVQWGTASASNTATLISASIDRVR